MSLFFVVDCLRDGDPSEKLKRKIKVISDAAGDHYDRYTDNIASAEEPSDGSALVTTAGTDGFNVQDQPVGGVASATSTRVNTPQQIYAKLWYVGG